MAYARLYLPGSTRAWYPSAFDGHDLFFGLVVEAEIDFDYFSLTDLHHLHNAEGRGVQLDHRYTPQPLGELQTAYERLFNQLQEDDDLGQKHHPTPFDDKPIEGFFYLDGDALARLFERDWTAGQKYAMLAFPSGEEYALWESSRPEQLGILHLFGEMDLPESHPRRSADHR